MIDRDEYSQTLLAMQRNYLLSVGEVRTCEIEAAAVEAACIMDRAIDLAEADFRTLERDTSTHGLHRCHDPR